jgi:hypothetical protein
MKQDSKGIVGVARAIYEQLGKAEFSKADVEELAKKVADKIPFQDIGRHLAIKLVSVGMKAAEAAGALYDNGTAPTDAPATTPAAPPAEAKGTVIQDAEVLPPGEYKGKEGGTP